MKFSCLKVQKWRHNNFLRLLPCFPVKYLPSAKVEVNFKNISLTFREILHKIWTSPKHKFAFSLVSLSSLQTIYLINKWNSLFLETRNGKVLALLAAFLDIGCLWQFCSTYTHLQILRAVDWQTSSILVGLLQGFSFSIKNKQQNSRFRTSSKAQAKKLWTFCLFHVKL